MNISIGMNRYISQFSLKIYRNGVMRLDLSEWYLSREIGEIKRVLKFKGESVFGL